MPNESKEMGKWSGEGLDTSKWVADHRGENAGGVAGEMSSAEALEIGKACYQPGDAKDAIFQAPQEPERAPAVPTLPTVGGTDAAVAGDFAVLDRLPAAQPEDRTPQVLPPNQV